MSKKILIVDDSKTDAAYLENILVSAGYEVVKAESPEEASKSIANERPDLVLMDLIIPGTSGFQLTKRFSQSKDTKDIPIIIISSKKSDVDKMWGIKNGAKDYFVKPVVKETLLPAISSVLCGDGYAGD